MVSLKYNLEDAGWADCEVDIDGQTATVYASYIDDALGGFAPGIRSLLWGMDEARFSFADEPGEYRWILIPRDQQLHCRILLFNDFPTSMHDKYGKVILNCRCDFHEFISASLAMMTGVLAEHGVDGYLKKWVRHEYPMKELREIEALVQSM